jgi:NTP pyrophosphatase (non-canonical NTP hydrolase)
LAKKETIKNTENLSVETSIKAMQSILDKYIQENGGYWEPLAMLAAVVEEVGEVAREISHLEKIKIKKLTEPQKEDQLSMEIGDLIFSIICIANYYKIDIGDAFKQTIKKYEQRDQNRFKKEK